MSQATTLARPYARAAFMLAKEAGALKDVSEALAFSAHAVAVPASPICSVIPGFPSHSCWI